jgi:hypothetical protein
MEGGDWNIYQSIVLGHILVPNIKFAPCLETGSSEDLQSIVEMLNSGILTVEGDFCTVFCSEARSYYILHKVGLKSMAFELLQEHFDEQGLCQSILPSETEKALSEYSFVTDRSEDPRKLELQEAVKEAQDKIKDLEEELSRTKDKLQKEMQRNKFLETTLSEGIKHLATNWVSKDSSPLPWGRQTSQEPSSFIMPKNSGKKVWSLQRAIPLGILPIESRIWSFVTAIDPEEVDSLRIAVSMLNSRELECDTNFVIVYSQTALCHYLVYPEGFELAAQKLVSDEFAWLTSTVASTLQS